LQILRDNNHAVGKKVTIGVGEEPKQLGVYLQIFRVASVKFAQPIKEQRLTIQAVQA